MRGNDVPDRRPLNPVNSWFANVPAAYPFYLVPIWHQVVLHFAQRAASQHVRAKSKGLSCGPRPPDTSPCPCDRTAIATSKAWRHPPVDARSRQSVHELYGITTPMTDEEGPTAGGEYASFAERWKPYRTWAVVLVRAAAHRLG